MRLFSFWRRHQGVWRLRRDAGGVTYSVVVLPAHSKGGACPHTFSSWDATVEIPAVAKLPELRFAVAEAPVNKGGVFSAGMPSRHFRPRQICCTGCNRAGVLPVRSRRHCDRHD
ncbi:hypothetical protein PHYPSEUDO_003808 [Phytophthora pseudosyringae]|uniref:Uncharacterized protein n=1 Tax=Phytophthora pseudosyringae TaxID=221518 RepID=A0A8T1WIE8_9STRA|nr:hypothetical protein PHYPSEUDO_003808 [Phytophthora pseudosyringae]